METIMILCPTVREAIQLMKDASFEYPGSFIVTNKCQGLAQYKDIIKFVFRGETEGYKATAGFHGKIITPLQFHDLMQDLIEKL